MNTRRSCLELVQVGDVVELMDDMLCTTGVVVAVLQPTLDLVVRWDLGSGWYATKPPGTLGQEVAYRSDEFEDLIVYEGRPFSAIYARNSTPA